jgi:hypothetical protein
MRRGRILHAAPALLVLAATGCTGLSASNVGDPTLSTRLEFESRLDLLHVGMPADSLGLLFAQAATPGQAGILREASIVTAEGTRRNVTLGWRSDPRHQTGYRESTETEIARALVVVEDARVKRIERLSADR